MAQNPRPVSFMAQVEVDAKTQGEAAQEFRKEVEGYLGPESLDGVRIASSEAPCPTCGRAQRKFAGFKKGKSTLTGTVTVLTTEPLAKVQEKLAKQGVFDVREGR